jgi:hypothetical protein
MTQTWVAENSTGTGTALAERTKHMSDGSFRINMICCTSVICDEVAAGLPQKQIALSYALAIKSEIEGADKPEWPVINAAILGRWKMSGLERIKKRAFDILRGKVSP